MTSAVLTLNAGSSSLKFALFEVAEGRDLKPTLRGQVEGIGGQPHLIARDAGGAIAAEHRWPGGGRLTQEDFLGQVFACADDHLGGVVGSTRKRVERVSPRSTSREGAAVREVVVRAVTA